MPDDNQANLLGEKLPQYLNTKAIVGHILNTDMKAREIDNYLVQKVMEFCRAHNQKMPAVESITRARRKFNADGLYLPSEKVLARRKENETWYRDAARNNLL